MQTALKILSQRPDLAVWSPASSPAAGTLSAPGASKTPAASRLAAQTSADATAPELAAQSAPLLQAGDVQPIEAPSTLSEAMSVAQVQAAGKGEAAVSASQQGVEAAVAAVHIQGEAHAAEKAPRQAASGAPDPLAAPVVSDAISSDEPSQQSAVPGSSGRPHGGASSSAPVADVLKEESAQSTAAIAQSTDAGGRAAPKEAAGAMGIPEPAKAAGAAKAETHLCEDTADQAAAPSEAYPKGPAAAPHIDAHPPASESDAAIEASAHGSLEEACQTPELGELTSHALEMGACAEQCAADGRRKRERPIELERLEETEKPVRGPPTVAQQGVAEGPASGPPAQHGFSEAEAAADGLAACAETGTQTGSAAAKAEAVVATALPAETCAVGRQANDPADVLAEGPADSAKSVLEPTAQYGANPGSGDAAALTAGRATRQAVELPSQASPSGEIPPKPPAQTTTDNAMGAATPGASQLAQWTVDGTDDESAHSAALVSPSVAQHAEQAPHEEARRDALSDSCVPEELPATGLQGANAQPRQADGEACESAAAEGSTATQQPVQAAGPCKMPSAELLCSEMLPDIAFDSPRQKSADIYAPAAAAPAPTRSTSAARSGRFSAEPESAVPGVSPRAHGPSRLGQPSGQTHAHAADTPVTGDASVLGRAGWAAGGPSKSQPEPSDSMPAGATHTHAPVPPVPEGAEAPRKAVLAAVGPSKGESEPSDRVQEAEAAVLGAVGSTLASQADVVASQASAQGSQPAVEGTDRDAAVPKADAANATPPAVLQAASLVAAVLDEHGQPSSAREESPKFAAASQTFLQDTQNAAVGADRDAAVPGPASADAPPPAVLQAAQSALKLDAADAVPPAAVHGAQSATLAITVPGKPGQPGDSGQPSSAHEESPKIAAALLEAASITVRPPKPKRSAETVPGHADHPAETAQGAAAPSLAAGHGPDAATQNFKLPQPVKVGATPPSSCIMGSHALLRGRSTQAERLEGLEICDSKDAAGKAFWPCTLPFKP